MKKTIKNFSQNDIGRWVVYTPKNEQGKIKNFDNTKKIAWIVYKCNENWDRDHWKDYTAAATNYCDIQFIS